MFTSQSAEQENLCGRKDRQKENSKISRLGQVLKYEVPILMYMSPLVDSLGPGKVIPNSCVYWIAVYQPRGSFVCFFVFFFPLSRWVGSRKRKQICSCLQINNLMLTLSVSCKVFQSSLLECHPFLFVILFFFKSFFVALFFEPDHLYILMFYFEINLSRKRMKVLRWCLKDFINGNNTVLNYEISAHIHIFYKYVFCVYIICI